MQKGKHLFLPMSRFLNMRLASLDKWKDFGSEKIFQVSSTGDKIKLAIVLKILIKTDSKSFRNIFPTQRNINQIQGSEFENLDLRAGFFQIKHNFKLLHANFKYVTMA